MKRQDRAGKGDASAEAAIRACGMQAERGARLPRASIHDRIVTADHRTADEPHEVLRRSTDEAARARDAAREMHRPGIVATVRGFLRLLWAAIYAFFGDGCSSMAASLSFYTFFSLPALLTLLLALVGRFAEPAQVERAITDQVTKLIGPASAAQVESIISNAGRSPGAASVATIVSLFALVLGATTAFAQLQSALNKAWGVKPDPRRNQIRVFLVKRVFSFGILITVAFLLLVSLALSTVIAAISSALTTRYGIPAGLLQVATALGSFLVIALLFAAMFRYLPDARIGWRDVGIGAIGTALLFVLGRTLIGVYLGSSDPGSVYGAAGSLALVLIWVYYTSMILLFGAEFTKLWAQRYGKGIAPVEGAVAYVEEERSVKTG
ncbi:MAG TPA: YihY/virulence factor BrkB family protein [Gemmatimonadaceae bacterium]|nr:YihY/virulence factor BrkB family protein [Gemmatimonadaceae bacterium]